MNTRTLRVRASTAVSAFMLLVACAPTGPSASPSAAPSTTVSQPPPTPTGRALPSPVLPVVAIIPTGNGPMTMAASTDTIWLELHREDKVARVDPVANLQTEVLDIPVHCDVATTPTSVWTAHPRQRLVTRFDPVSGEVIQQFDVSDACFLATDVDEVWVSSPGLGRVYVFREGEAEAIDIHRVGRNPFVIDLLPDSAWVSGEADGGTVWRIDRATGGVTTIGLFEGADEVEIGFDAVWVTSRPNGHLWKLDPADGSILGQVDINAPSGSVAIGDTLWVVSYDGTLTGLDPTTLEVTYSERLPYAYLGTPIFAFDSLWTAALENNVLLRIAPPVP